MTKLFKNSKQIVAFIFAFAILAVSLFTGGINIAADACDVSKVDYWDGTLATKFASGNGTEANPYIIETAEQLAFCCLGQNPSTSSNKYYKVSDTIKTFVMQPENVVDINELLALDSPEAVAEYFNGLEGKVNWISKFNGLSFNGHFDGNGATVYGLYATTNDTAREDVGLFPQYDGGTRVGSKLVSNVCKNIAVKNSYYYSKRRLGAIAGASYLAGYGAKIDGKVTIDSCEVVNCYMTGDGNWSLFQEQGVVAGGGAGDIIILNNILVKDVYAYNNEQSAIINLVGNGSTKKAKEQYQNTVSNSIILGTAPYGIDCYSSTVHEPYEYTNVVTDYPTGLVDLTVPASKTTIQKDYTDRIFSITETGYAFKQAATMLDWKNVWFMGKNGPELQVFHDDLKLVTTTTTHTWICDCCDDETVEGAQPHNFVLDGTTVKGDGTDVYKCADCDYACQHNEQTDATYDAGDCVTKAGFYTKCKFCKWYYADDLADAPGHTFTYVESDIGDCEVEGHVAYWLCTVCNNKFSSDDAFAPMDAAVSDESLSTGFGPHTKEEDENGPVILYDEYGHWFVCSVNGGRLDINSNAIAEDGVIKHKFKDSKCTTCNFVCTEHKYADITEESKIIVIGDCFTDEQTEIKCTICGHKSAAITEKASHKIVLKKEVLPDDRMEGSKAHYKCDACNEIFADSKGETKVTQTSLIIPRVLPEEYHELINAYSGSTSPSTSDNLGSVFALVALAGAALVVARKVK